MRCTTRRTSSTCRRRTASASFGALTGSALFFVPLVWLGFDPQLVFATLTLNLLYQFWIHATWIPKLGWLEYVLNTPSAHRVHHAANLEYLDANYGGVLIVFDRLFGTYLDERDDLPCRYGLVIRCRLQPAPDRVAPVAALGRDLLGARSLRAVVGYLSMPPGWRPDGSGATTEDLRARQRPGARDAAPCGGASRRRRPRSPGLRRARSDGPPAGSPPRLRRRRARAPPAACAG